jgi:tetratricopeptide (TPR) repeat protein
LQLGEPDDDLEPRRDTLVDAIQAGTEGDTEDPTLTTLALFDVDDVEADEWGKAEPSHDAPTCPIPGAGDAPPIPTSYERHLPRDLTTRLLGAGLGLYGLRPVPLVGRSVERRIIWERLRDVATTARPSFILLRGPTGQGKSRLAEWTVERAHELGSATILEAHHAPIASGSHGLGAMLARHFQCMGVERGAVLRHLRDRLGDKPPFDQLSVALTEIVHPSSGPTVSADGEESMVRFSNMAERYATIGQLLEQLSLTRPIILWLDDVQWGADALGLAEYLLGRPELRILILATLRSDLTEGRPLEQARVERLLEHERARAIDVEPLEPADHRDLIRHLLGLEGELARQVETRTQGSPLFAVQLVGDWVRRGVLEVGKEGFRLRQGESAELPDSLHELWAARVAQLVDATGAPASTLEALELAAALGERVHREEWEQLCSAVHVPVPSDLVGRLVESGLGRPDALGWVFCHGMFRESLAKTAATAGRSREQHRACATMLRKRYGDTPELAERLGHHLHEGGDVTEALQLFERAIAYRFDRGDFDRVRQVLGVRTKILDEGGASPDDRRRLGHRLWRVRVWLAQGDYDAAGRELRAAETTARDHDDLAVICQLHAELRWSKGEMTEAMDLAEGARRQFEAIGDQGGAADCRRIAAKCLLEASGEPRQALEHARAARRAYETLDDGDRLAECDYLEAKILTELADYETAVTSCIAAREHHRALGHRLGLAKCANQMGEIARLRGQLAEAEHHYLRALELLEAMGSDLATGVRLNLALVLIDRERYGRALHELEQLQRHLARGNRGRALAYVDYALLPCLAAERAWLELDEQVDRAAQWVPETGRVDKDYAALAERAAALAESQGQRSRAITPLRLAVAHWEAMGKEERASLARRRITALETVADR